MQCTTKNPLHPGLCRAPVACLSTHPFYFTAVRAVRYKLMCGDATLSALSANFVFFYFELKEYRLWRCSEALTVCSEMSSSCKGFRGLPRVVILNSSMYLAVLSCLHHLLVKNQHSGLCFIHTAVQSLVSAMCGARWTP